MKTVSNIAGVARRLLIANHPDLKLGHGLELVAASLGYKSQSAYKTAVDSGLEAVDLSRIRHFLPDLASVAQRAQSLGLSVTAREAKDAIQEAWRRETPYINLYPTEYILFETLREDFAEAIEKHDEIVRITAEMNCEGLSYSNLYLPLEALYQLPVEFGSVSIDVKEDIVMQVDRMRPYLGHIATVHATFSINRLGKRVFSKAGASLSRAFNKNSDDEHSVAAELPSKIRFSQAIAWLLQIRQADAETLVGCDIISNKGPSGIVYDWTLDFSEVGSKRLLAHIASVHGTKAGAGKVPVPAEFFENITSTEGRQNWPDQAQS